VKLLHYVSKIVLSVIRSNMATWRGVRKSR